MSNVKLNSKLILRQAQDGVLHMLMNEVMVSLSNYGAWTSVFIWLWDFDIRISPIKLEVRVFQR